MSSYGKLPNDYALDALTQEADRRGKARGDPSYSYGKLMADTSSEEREQICEKYRRKFLKKHGGTKIRLDVTEQEMMDRIRKKAGESED